MNTNQTPLITSRLAKCDKEKHYDLIMSAMERLGVARANDLMNETGLSWHQVSRRISELREMGKLKETGFASVNESGNLCRYVSLPNVEVILNYKVA